MNKGSAMTEAPLSKNTVIADNCISRRPLLRHTLVTSVDHQMILIWVSTVYLIVELPINQSSINNRYRKSSKRVKWSVSAQQAADDIAGPSGV